MSKAFGAVIMLGSAGFYALARTHAVSFDAQPHFIAVVFGMLGLECALAGWLQQLASKEGAR